MTFLSPKLFIMRFNSFPCETCSLFALVFKKYELMSPIISIFFRLLVNTPCAVPQSRLGTSRWLVSWLVGKLVSYLAILVGKLVGCMISWLIVW